MRARLIDALVPAVHKAAALIEKVRLAGPAARDKIDASPVTEADEGAEILLTAALRALDPDALIVGEEACATHGKPEVRRRFWLIDPLDGTRSFIDGGPDYSINIALVEDGLPVLGIVQAPRAGTLWAGAMGEGAWRSVGEGPREPIRTRALPERPIIVTSRSHRDAKTDAYAARIEGADTRPSGSSLKFCMLAEGSADIYPRFGATSEWDTAAAHAVLLAAGGAMRGADGEPFRYGKPDYLNGPFLALGDPDGFAKLPALG